VSAAPDEQGSCTSSREPHTGVSVIAIRKALPSDFAEVYSSLLVQFRNPYLKRDDYAGLFRRQWASAEDWHGFVLVDGDSIVGFLGLIFAKRLIRGREYHFANLTHWFVRESYRQHSLRLIMEAVKLDGYVLTTLTPTPPVAPLYVRLRWQEIDHRNNIIVPLPYLRIPGLSRRLRLVFSPGDIEKRLTGEEARIFREHRPYKCRHLFIDGGEDGGCYVVYTRVWRKRLPFVQVHYVGNAALFRKAVGQLRWRLCIREKVAGLLVDARFLRGSRIFPPIYHYEPRFFRPPKGCDLARQDLDALYSEYIVTNV